MNTYTAPQTNSYYIASFIIVNHLAFCQAWSLNEYVMLSYVMLCKSFHTYRVGRKEDHF